MDLNSLLKLALKRWWVVIITTVLAVAAGILALSSQPVQYSAQASFALIRATVPIAGRDDPLQSNPLSAGSGLYGGTTLLQDSVIAQLTSPEIRAQVSGESGSTTYSIGIPRNDQGQATSQVANVAVISESEQRSRQVAEAVIARASLTADATQQEVGAPPTSRYKLFVISAPQISEQRPSTARFIIGSLMAGLLGGLALAFILEVLLRRLHTRRNAKSGTDSVGGSNGRTPVSLDAETTQVSLRGAGRPR